MESAEIFHHPLHERVLEAGAVFDSEKLIQDEQERAIEGSFIEYGETPQDKEEKKETPKRVAKK